MEPRGLLPPRRWAAGDFDRTKARPAHAKAIGVRRTRPPHEGLGLVAESREHAAQQFGGLARGGRAADAAGRRIVADVLVRAGEDRRREERPLGYLDRK